MKSQQGVGLVVVSHSRGLASAAVALASQMVHGRQVAIEVAAGLDETTFGTDAVRIKEAIERVDGPAGVVVLMDLGSAVLSAELALDLLADPTARDRVVLSPAPIVEGLVVAAVAAAGGASRDEVAAEARSALMGKAAQLASVDDVDPSVAVAVDVADELAAVFTIDNEHGLHARPASRLVAEIRGLDAAVSLRNLTTGSGAVPANSLSRVATLAALDGHELEVRASGPQAQEAIEHVLALAKRRFDEPEKSGESFEAPAEETATGPIAASPGVAIGPLRKPTIEAVDPHQEVIADEATEWRALVRAVAEVRRELEQLRAATLKEIGVEEAAIFDAHLAVLADPEILADVKKRISTGIGANLAWSSSLTNLEEQWAQLPDSYLRGRAADIYALRQHVLRALTGQTRRHSLKEGILVARDLSPADAAALDLDLVKGVILAGGSASSHAAILARARDIPLVVAAGPDILSLPEGTLLAVDGSTGEIHVSPSAKLVAAFRHRADEEALRRAKDLDAAGQPAVSRDGRAFVVAANVGSVLDGKAASSAGADEAGLVRTEFLFLGRSTAPTVDEQQAEYHAIADAMAGRRVTLRTLDVGGDKPLAYLPMAREENPFLGLRGLRLALSRPELLRQQLEAMCQTARTSPVSIMFPMVSTVDELVAARAVLQEAAGEAGLPDDLQVGMMVEVPAAALKIESFLPHLDFVSIGTNDLTQYTLAAERGNAAVAALSDALDPAVLRLIELVCRACDGRVHVAVCGEVASDEAAIPVLAGLGVRELSVSPPAVPRVKAALRRLSVDACAAVAQQALTLASAAQVRQLVASAELGTAAGLEDRS